MPKHRSIHAGGYNLQKAEKLQSIQLPPKIKCKQCNKLQTPAYGYSNKQLDEFRNGIATGQIKQEQQQSALWIRCRSCVGQQKNEMFCYYCEHWKGLDGFTKAQRRTPDKARCLECVHDHLTEEPMFQSAEEAALRDLLDDSDDDDDISNAWETTTVDESDAGVPLSGHLTDEINMENLRNLAITDHHDVSDGRPQRTTSSKAGPVFLAYDSHGKAHERPYAASEAGTDMSLHTARTAGPEIKKESKFAKERAGRAAPKAPLPYQGARKADTDSDVDSDADTDDSYGVI